MKRRIGIVAVVGLCFLFVGCSGKKPKGEGGDGLGGEPRPQRPPSAHAGRGQGREFEINPRQNFLDNSNVPAIPAQPADAAGGSNTIGLDPGIGLQADGVQGLGFNSPFSGLNPHLQGAPGFIGVPSINNTPSVAPFRAIFDSNGQSISGNNGVLAPASSEVQVPAKRGLGSH